MLDIGGFRAQSCQGLTRRSFVTAAASLPALWGATESLAAAAPKAKSVIFVWLWGAPSHLDMFDPKPDAPSSYRGPFSTIATRTPGVRYTELLPRLAARSDRFTLVRSNRTSKAGHPDAGSVGLTGYEDDNGPIQPSFGSIVGRHRGYGRLPPFMAVGNGIPRDVVKIVDGYGGGRWGKSFDPFMVQCSDAGKVNIPTLKLLDDLSPRRLDDRRLLLGQMDQLRRQVDQPRLRDWQQAFDSAYDLLVSDAARKALDLSQESTATRAQFGHTAFGQSCLLARRLVESGVPFVQVNWSQYVEAMTPNCDFGWDTHIYNFDLLPDRHCPIFDRAFSALLDDLHDRGLLKDTLVVAMGEFGRTPKINVKAARDHWPRCYFSLWAGGGVQSGRTIGASDKLGEDPITEPVTPLMVGTTIAELTGIGAQQRAELGVLDGGRVFHELL